MGTSASRKTHKSMDASIIKKGTQRRDEAVKYDVLCFSGCASRSVQSRASTPGARALRILRREVELGSEQLVGALAGGDFLLIVRELAICLSKKNRD